MLFSYLSILPSALQWPHTNFFVQNKLLGEFPWWQSIVTAVPQLAAVVQVESLAGELLHASGAADKGRWGADEEKAVCKKYQDKQVTRA